MMKDISYICTVLLVRECSIVLLRILLRANSQADAASLGKQTLGTMPHPLHDAFAPQPVYVCSLHLDDNISHPSNVVQPDKSVVQVNPVIHRPCDVLRAILNENSDVEPVIRAREENSLVSQVEAKLLNGASKLLLVVAVYRNMQLSKSSILGHSRSILW